LKWNLKNQNYFEGFWINPENLIEICKITGLIENNTENLRKNIKFTVLSKI
jgi:hypothetical protein